MTPGPFVQARALVKGAALAAARLSGLNRAIRRSTRRAVRVLCYHGVVRRPDARAGDAGRNTIGIDEFAYHLGVLRRVCHPISAAEWIDALDRGTRVPERAVLVTFDDGYRNNLTNAAPLLEAYGIPALFCISTGYIGGHDRLWTQEISLRVEGWRGSVLPLPGERAVMRLRAGCDRRAIAERIRERCKRIPDEERRAYLATLRDGGDGPCPGDDEDSLTFLNWDEVRELSRRGFEIGSHTVDHPMLSRLDPGALTYQLQESRRTIEAQLERRCVCIAYPNGRAVDVSPAVVRRAAEIGYRLGFAVTDRFHDPHDSPLSIGRIAVPGHLPRNAFHSRISGLHALARRWAAAAPLPAVAES